jgi:hypothetical protein
MNPIALGTAAGAAAFTLGSSALAAAGRGLSFAAELAREATSIPAKADQPGMSANPTPASASKATDQAADVLRERITQRLSEAGVPLSQPVTLVSNGQGGIAVVGPHPQQAQIEEALGSDLLLERDFNQLASQVASSAAPASDGSSAAGFSLTVSPPAAGLRFGS